MLRIYCPVCNGLLRLEDGQREAVCVNCGTRVAVPQGYTEAESSYLFAAEAMQRRDFEGAYQTYTEILSAHPEQAEAHFKRALALYEIEYQEIGEGRRRLVCHQAGKANFLGNADVQQALELSEELRKSFMRSRRRRSMRFRSRYLLTRRPIPRWMYGCPWPVRAWRP